MKYKTIENIKIIERIAVAAWKFVMFGGCVLLFTVAVCEILIAVCELL